MASLNGPNHEDAEKLPMSGLAQVELSEDHDKLISAFECITREPIATYVSGPLTTGRLFYDWYCKTGQFLDREAAQYRIQFERSVLRANESAILRAAKVLRADVGGVVIEPTALRVLSWRQTDFHRFWCDVISKFCGRLIVVEGWEFSVGCAVEVMHATRTGISVQGLDGREISASAGASAVAAAAAHIENVCAGAGYLSNLAQQLRNSVAPEDSV
jgi:hypothetical protein